MTDNFNFLGLPKEVRELIIDEIVQIPEDRIELALTSKYCNEVVKRKNPKKTIDRLTIESPSRLTFMSNSRIYVKKKEQLMEILSNCQIKKLVLADKSKSITPNYSEILDMLFEAAKFATKLDIIPIHPVYMDEIVGFYTKLKYLKSVTIGNPKFILPYYPSKVRLVLGRRQPENYLQGLAKKSRNCPLSVFKLECGFFCFGECQQFLPTAKFSIGAEIRIRTRSPHCAAHLTHVGQNTFTFEMCSRNCMPIFISQKFGGGNRRILKLKTKPSPGFKQAVNVVSALNSEKNYFSDVFQENQRQMVINLENVDRDEILKVKFMDRSRAKYFLRPIYCAKMLESAFPTTNFTTPRERVEKINNLLGTNIQLIQADNFVRIAKDFLQNSRS